MPVSPTEIQREISAFPPWLELPPGYTVSDWILWQKGILIAARLRNDPSLVIVALERLQNRKNGLYFADQEWLELLQSKDAAEIASLLDSPGHDAQRLRSSSPFVREAFIERQQTEAIHARAHLG